MSGPFLVVVAGFVTAYLAAKSSDGLVDDDYYKQGLAINQDTARMRRAVELGVRAQLRFDNEHRLVRVALDGGVPENAPESLTLRFVHPTRSGLDETLLLRPESPGVYSAGLVEPLRGRWHIVLEDIKREWRLSDEQVVDQNAVLMLPAF